MKKFLTVLLALSVVFTYTVGTAFASAATDQISAKATAEKTALSDAVDAALKTIVYNQDGYVVTPNTYTNVDKVSKTVVDKLGAKVKTDYSAKIDAEAKNQTIADAYNGAALEAVWADVKTPEGVLDVIFADDCKDALIEQYPIEKAAALAELAKIDASAYNPYDYTTDNDTADSDKDKVAKAIADAQTAINGIAAPTDATTAAKAIDDAKNAVTTAKGKLPAQTLAEQQKELSDTKAAAKTAVETAAKNLKDELTKDYTDVITGGGTPSAVADAQAKLAALDSNIALVTNKYNTIIDNAAISADDDLTAAKAVATGAATAAQAALADEASMNAAIAALGDVDALITYAQQYAAAMKTMVNPDGTVKFNATTVDEALEKVIADIKKDVYTTTSAVKAALDATTTAAQEKTNLDNYKTQQKTALATAYPADKYSEENKAVIADLIEKAEKAIDAAADKKAVDTAVKAAKAELDAVLTSAEESGLNAKVDTALNTYEYAKDANGTEGALEGYFDAMAAKNPTKDYTAAKADTLKNAAKVFYDAVLAQNNPDLTQAQVDAIVKENYNAALAVIDATKSADEIKEAANAVVALINNIPSTVDASAKDVVLTANKAYEDYCDLAGADESLITNSSTLTAAVKKLIDVEKNAVTDQIKALNQKVLLGTFSLDDAAAVEAARAAYDAYKDTYKDLPGYAPISETDLKALETKIEDLNFKDAANKINALPSTITLEDADAVKAAADAYAKLTDEQKKAMNPLMVAKLEAAQDQLKKLADKSVEALKITASSTQGKNYIKVKWTVKGDASAIDGYEVFRSVKKNSGFGTKPYFKTTKKTYKNTKSLKKGTRYYYKVRAYKVVDGKTYYSDWSNKAYRTYKYKTLK